MQRGKPRKKLCNKRCTEKIFMQARMQCESLWPELMPEKRLRASKPWLQKTFQRALNLVITWYQVWKLYRGKISRPECIVFFAVPQATVHTTCILPQFFSTLAPHQDPFYLYHHLIKTSRHAAWSPFTWSGTNTNRSRFWLDPHKSKYWKTRWTWVLRNSSSSNSGLISLLPRRHK